MEEPFKPPTVRADEDELTSDYANNYRFVPTIWDLKILFGELSANVQAIDWHTSITLPWAQAKLLAYYLQLNIAAHEIEVGSISIPESMIPPEPPQLPDAAKDKLPARAMYDFVKSHHQTFIEDLRKKK